MSTSNEDWIAKAEAALENKEKIIAAGQFGLSDDCKKITAGGIGASLLMPNMDPGGDGL